MSERTTFLVVSDHGFKKYTKQVRPAVALAKAGLEGKVFVLAEGGSAYVYFDPAHAAELLPKVTRALEGVDGIDKVIGRADFGALGLPQPDRDPQMYQLLLTAKTGYSFSGATGGPVTAEDPQQAGSHGYLATTPEMDPIFIASGYGVRPAPGWKGLPTSTWHRPSRISWEWRCQLRKGRPFRSGERRRPDHSGITVGARFGAGPRKGHRARTLRRARQG